MADDAEAKGNAAFSAGKFTEAIYHYSVAIYLAPTNHLLYSNRSGAYASLHQYREALLDAMITVHLKPDWSYGYARLGAAYDALKLYYVAIEHFTHAINLDPADHLLYSNRSFAYASLKKYSEALSDAKKIVHLKPDWSDGYLVLGVAHQSLKQYDEAILAYKKALELDPSDERVKLWISYAESAKLGSGRPGMGSSPLKERMEAQPEPMDEEERELEQKKVNAQKENEKGNAAYKKKDFETAIECYTKAVEFDNGDISFLTNRAAVYLEMGKFDECIKDCEKAVERGRELRSDSKMVAMALVRKGSALVKMAKTCKDYEPAIETFQRALIEHHNPDTLKELNDAERAKKELELQEYHDSIILREKELTKRTKSLITISFKYNELLLAHASDIKSLNEKIIAECKQFHEDLKQLEADNKLLQ